MAKDLADIEDGENLKPAVGAALVMEVTESDSGNDPG